MTDALCPVKFCKKCATETERYASGRCKPCARASSVAWQAANPDHHKARSAAWYVANNAKAKETRAAWHAANTDKIKAVSAAWHAANPDRAKAHGAAWRSANQERHKALNAAWHAANPERARANGAAWRAANPEAKRISEHNRNSRKRANGGVLSKGLAAKLFKLQRGLCPCCKQPLGDDFHLDHINAVSTGGMNIDSNMQLLRKICNLKKGAKHPIEFMQQKGFLL